MAGLRQRIDAVQARVKGAEAKKVIIMYPGMSNVRLRDEVQTRLIDKLSPEQIEHRLKVDFPDDLEMRVTHETIYVSLYVQGKGSLRRDLAACLRTGRALRKPRRHAARERAARAENRIPGRVLISQRPDIADRVVPGHWEGDLITGTENKSAIRTLVERTTGFVILLHLPHDHGALAVQEVMIHKMAQLPKILLRTLTWDQGIEMRNHAQIAAATAWTSTSATHTHPGNAAPTRTPTDSCARTSPKAPTSPATSTTSPPNSTTDAVARALAQEAPLVVPDEPTNQVDVRAQLELLGLVRDLGVATLAALHDLDHAASHADRVAVLDRGRLVAQGLPLEVLTAPLVAEVFGVQAHIGPHPIHGRPHIAVAPLQPSERADHPCSM